MLQDHFPKSPLWVTYSSFAGGGREIAAPKRNNKKNKNIQRAQAFARGNTTQAGAGAVSGQRLTVPNQLAVITFNRPNPMPVRKLVQFRYCDDIILSTGAAGVMCTDYQYRLNSLFDPNLTAAGHQPLGFDQMCPALYGRYKVYRCDFSLVATTPGGTSDIQLSAQVTSAASVLALGGNAPAYVRERFADGTAMLSSSGDRRAVVRASVPIHQVFGFTQTEFNGDIAEMSAVYNANPVQQALLNFAVGSPAGSGAESCVVMVELIFFAELSERVIEAPS